MQKADDFYGLPAQSIQNDFLKIDFLENTGPRLVRLLVKGSSLEGNLFAEVPQMSVSTPYGEYNFRGGHRLWHSPEVFPRTYIPDNEGLEVEELSDGVRLRQPVETSTGIRKMMGIHMLPDRPAVTVVHQLTNEGLWSVRLAPWAITQLRPGGVGIFPQKKGPANESQFLPNRKLVMWPYSQWHDPRLELQDGFILVNTQSLPYPLKIGYWDPHGWAAYTISDLLFVKRFELLEGPEYPDMGCNVETYVNDLFLELETVGPYIQLDPGASVSHTEVWEFYTKLNYPSDLEGIQAMAADLKL